jgi:hypothetical protein
MGLMQRQLGLASQLVESERIMEDHMPKYHLNDLQVKSFITSMRSKTKAKVNGGNTAGFCHTYDPDICGETQVPTGNCCISRFDC